MREVTLDHEVVWRYVNPMGTFGATVQGNNPMNGVFRAERYADAYPPRGNGVLEIDPFPQPCALSPEPSFPHLNMNYLIDVGDVLALLLLHDGVRRPRP